jgi:hypothetical protein
MGKIRTGVEFHTGPLCPDTASEPSGVHFVFKEDSVEEA